MNKLIFPLKLLMQGDAVADLQDALRLLLDKGLFQKDSVDEKISERLRSVHDC